ncbi:bifunctional phosphatase PAP2/O-acyltransferase family protein [Amycolatopsis sp.]|uniref:bifunctional phosphatase PAP2/O-acyltransferase family protein n=1 Tax=Amycolatopsis sp. TaxID=37632 RepID=UPI002CA1932F|nr:phosphatase PAP2 family protein [Amycolatopsis sp.]HVV13356.1 phosphatase PAP2 family protein [Amycolatopsis sp.]
MADRIGTPKRPRWWAELLGGLALFGVYLLIESRPLPSREARAMGYGQWILDFERGLHLGFEHGMNVWLAGQGWLRTFANYEYAITYIASALLLLFWVYVWHPADYRRVRNSFVLVNLLALACFWLLPVAPPRMLPGAGFVDTVRLGHTWGSWGSPMVENANQLAAMPSLHVGWALWVSVVLARLARGRAVQVVSAVHVLVTLLVILATGNHYWLDAAVAVVVVATAVMIADVARRPATRIPASDAFFLHVETPEAPQHVGGLIMLDTTRAAGPPTFEFARDAIAARLHDLPGFRQRLVPPTKWRPLRWTDHPEIDWAWHVPVFDLSLPDGSPGGMAALHRLVGQLAGTPLPRDRPLWRFCVVTGVEEGLAAAVSLVHHSVADGIGTINMMLRLFDSPDMTAAIGEVEFPGRAKKIAGGVVGLAQLATDHRPEAQLPVSGTADRSFGTVRLELEWMRELARARGVRVTDLLLAASVAAMRRVAKGPLPSRMLVSVPLMAAVPRPGMAGNVTAAVMIEVPTGDMPETERLRVISKASARLRGGTRAIASRFVMHSVANLMPPVFHGWFSRFFYGSRIFNGIVSNMPGAAWQVDFGDYPLQTAYPIIPLAPGTPFVIGVLGWYRDFSMSVATDPAFIPDTAAFIAEFRKALAEFG